MVEAIHAIGAKDAKEANKVSGASPASKATQQASQNNQIEVSTQQEPSWVAVLRRQPMNNLHKLGFQN